jgi:uncharacterized lipoprotein YmbA
MFRPLIPALFASFSVLVACSSDVNRYTVQAPASAETIRIAFGSVEIRDVSLPSYAAADEITTERPDGVLASTTDVLWADSPERAVELELARHLAKLTGARVASDPWPFEAFPDARLEVRFEQLLAGADGVYRAQGQYFVAVETGRERAGLFDLSTPYAVEGGPQALAAARGGLILDVAEFIARNGLR